jgi:hypothetical protein
MRLTMNISKTFGILLVSSALAQGAFAGQTNSNPHDVRGIIGDSHAERMRIKAEQIANETRSQQAPVSKFSQVPNPHDVRGYQGDSHAERMRVKADKFAKPRMMKHHAVTKDSGDNPHDVRGYQGDSHAERMRIKADENS